MLVLILSKLSLSNFTTLEIRVYDDLLLKKHTISFSLPLRICLDLLRYIFILLKFRTIDFIQ